MSDLQVTLLVIGVAVVVGIIAFNWFQERRLRRRLDGSRRDTPLEPRARAEAARAPPARPETRRDPPRRVEPVGAAAAAPPVPGTIQETHPATAPSLPPVPGFDPDIDYIVAIDAPEPISAAGLADLHTRAAACGRRFRVYGFDSTMNEWQEAGRLSGGRYGHLRVALQLVRRSGAVDGRALTALCAAAQECAQRFSATASCPDIHETLVRARDLDAFCADADIAIGLNVVAARGAKFAGTRIRALAEEAGFRLEPHGVFHYTDPVHQTLFTLDNHEPAPFLPEQIKQLATDGITLLLDVPRVAEGHAALGLMVKIGNHLAEGLDGTLVDDNRVVLTDKSILAIQQQLKAIHTKMEARGIPAGSERALRLFS